MSAQDTLARIAWKMTPDSRSKAVVVGIATSEGEEIVRELPRRVADDLPLGDYCAMSELADVIENYDPPAAPEA